MSKREPITIASKKIEVTPIEGSEQTLRGFEIYPADKTKGKDFDGSAVYAETHLMEELSGYSEDSIQQRLTQAVSRAMVQIGFPRDAGGNMTFDPCPPFDSDKRRITVMVIVE